MWIEKITLYGFGGITNEEIEFATNDVNLIVERNEYGKSTLAEGIWATLFDFPEHGTRAATHERETMKPWDEKAPYKAVLDLTVNDRPLQVIRNFEKKEVQVIDRNTNADVTAEFTGASKTDGRSDGGDQIGFLITGMSRDLFRNTCLLGQRHLDAHHVSSSSDIAPILQGMADTATPVSTAGGAVDALNEAQNNYSFAGAPNRRMSLDDAINELEAQRNEMLKKLLQMDEEQKQTAEWISEFSQLCPGEEEEEALAPVQDVDPAAAAEFDAAKLDLKELERRIGYATQRFELKVKLEDDLKAVDLNAPVTSPVTATLKDLWTRRSSRKTDADRLAEEIQPQQEEYERFESQISEQYRALEPLTPDEANAISALAINMYKLQQELTEKQREHQEQTGRHLQRLMMSTKQHGTALDTLKSLSRAEIEEAKNYSSLLIMFYDQVQEEQKKIQEVKFSLEDIEERRKGNRNANTGKMIGCFAASIVCLIFLISTHDLKDIPHFLVISAVGVMLLSLLAGLVFVAMIINFRYFLKDDASSAADEEGKHRKALAAVKTKIQNLEAKLTSLALKTGCGTKDELIKYINEASTHDDVLSEQENRDQTLGNEEARMRKLQKDLAYYFEKAGRDSSVIDSQRAMDLSQEIAQYYKEKEAIENQFQEIRTARKQLDFLINEIADIDREIVTVLNRSGVEVAVGSDEDLETKISELLQVNTERQALLNEIARVEYDLTEYPDPADAINNMEFERDVLQDRIRNLIADNPELQSRPDPETGAPQKAVIPWGASAADRSQNAETKAKKEELLVKIRTAMNYRDEHFLETTEELANIDHELTCARRAKIALTMARDVIKQLSSETYEDWSQQLNLEAESLISQLNLDIERLTFDHALRLSLKLKGHDREFDSQDITTRLSTGTREQVHWLARIILTSFLSKRQPLPIVLDEPFSEADDDRFLGMMRFLINVISPHNQIIILSCHQQRHQWLASQLNLDEKERLSFRSRNRLASEEKSPGAVR